MVRLLFFSSRRRHTRWTGDWSSDVCSSDLVFAAALPVLAAVGEDAGEELFTGFVAAAFSLGEFGLGGRSEERRVGKECRRWGSSHLGVTARDMYNADAAAGCGVVAVCHGFG